MPFQLGSRRGTFLDITEQPSTATRPIDAAELACFEDFDLIYRSLCALLYNYVPTSGHPGGSISSGRFVFSILFDTMEYDVGNPEREDADIISYAAGHKALGLYAMWALRNEIVRIGVPDLLPEDKRRQLRLEDLLGFRRNPVMRTPLFRDLQVKPLDGHPTPATPFVRLSTGASGVGVATSLGLALGAKDYYGDDAPVVHIVEGEGGLTPGRVAEALAAAGTANLDNVVLHVDWNQASIDSDRVCRENDQRGDYVQWNPMELAYLHDWNVVYVPDGSDLTQVIAAQRAAMALDGRQPTAIVYRTRKGWRYGIEGRASHGAGHKLCSDAFFETMQPLLTKYDESLPSCCDLNQKRCSGEDGASVIEECLWQALLVVRRILESDSNGVARLAARLVDARDRLDRRGRKPRKDAPRVEAVYEMANGNAANVPPALAPKPGMPTTLRGELGRVLNHYNRASNGAMFAAAADLLGSTSINSVAAGFPEGFYNAAENPGARLLSVGGICEDAMAGVMSGLASYGHHIGAASSYGAFIAALGHIAARLHAIGGQARKAIVDAPYNPMILVCAHAGLKTGEDGPTHADPQPLQLVQENFPRGTSITLTPWDPQELWPLMTATFERRPAVIVPFVTRPDEIVPDRAAIGLAPATDSVTGVYALRQARGKGDGTLVLQGSGVAFEFVNHALPELIRHGIDLNVYYVASAELFDLLPAADRRRIFPDQRAQEAMGITGFTLPTMYRWIRSTRGIEATLHPFRDGHFLGSGVAARVLEEAGLDGESQTNAVLRHLEHPVHT
jgi:transketolase